jgi:hypothetical protein
LCPLSSVLCPLSSVLCPLSSVLRLLSSVPCSLSSVGRSLVRRSVTGAHSYGEPSPAVTRLTVRLFLARWCSCLVRPAARHPLAGVSREPLPDEHRKGQRETGLVTRTRTARGRRTPEAGGVVHETARGGRTRNAQTPGAGGVVQETARGGRTRDARTPEAARVGRLPETDKVGRLPGTGGRETHERRTQSGSIDCRTQSVPGDCRRQADAKRANAGHGRGRETAGDGRSVLVIVNRAPRKKNFERRK